MASGSEIALLMVRLTGNNAGYLRMLNQSQQATFRAAAQMTGALAAIGGAFASIKAFATFDKAMTEATSIMDVTGDQIEEMRKQALTLSTETAFAPAELAKSFYHLASAGLSAEASMKALPAVAQFATAGAFDLEKATELLSQGQSAMGMTSDNAAQNHKNMVRISNVLVKANMLATGTTKEFAVALTRQAGPAARQAGRSIEETVAVLTAYHKAGMKGELAGNMFGRASRLLESTAIKNAKAQKKWGFSVFDAQGQVRNFADIIENLEQVFAKLSPEQRQAAELQMGFRAQVKQSIGPLLGMSSQIRQWQKELTGTNVAADVANKQMKAFSNRMMMLWNSVKVLAIEIGEFLAPALSAIGGIVRSLLQWWLGLSVGTKKVAMSFGLLAVSILMIKPAMLAFSIMGPMIGSMFGPFVTILSSLKFALIYLNLIFPTFGSVASFALRIVSAGFIVLRAAAAVVAPLLLSAFSGLAAGAMMAARFVGMIVFNLFLMLNPLRLFITLASFMTMSLGALPTILKFIASGLWMLLNPLRAISLMWVVIKGAIFLAGAAFNSMFGGIGILIGLLVTAGVLIAVWVEQMGGLTGAWDAVSAAAGAAWAWIKGRVAAFIDWVYPVFQAFRSFMSMIWEGITYVVLTVVNAVVDAFMWLWGKIVAIWEAITGAIVPTITEIRDNLQLFIIDAEFFFRNFARYADYAFATAAYQGVKWFNEMTHFFTVTGPYLLGYFSRNWKELFVQIVYNAGVAFKAIFTNLKALVKKLPDILRGREVDWSEIWKPIREGMLDLVTEELKLPPRVVGDLEEELRKNMEKMGMGLDKDRLAFRSQKLFEFAIENLELVDLAPTAEAKKAGGAIGKALTEGFKGEFQRFDATLFRSAEAITRLQEFRDRMDRGHTAEEKIKRRLGFEVAIKDSGEAKTREGEQIDILKQIRDGVNRKGPGIDVGDADLEE